MGDEWREGGPCQRALHHHFAIEREANLTKELYETNNKEEEEGMTGCQQSSCYSLAYQRRLCQYPKLFLSKENRDLC